MDIKKYEIEDQLFETLGKLKEFRNTFFSNEQAVRTQLIEPILNVLGWKTSNPKYVRMIAPGEDGKIPDYVLLKDSKASLIVEAKDLSVDLQNKTIINQVAQYSYQYSTKFGILTNGVKWLLVRTYAPNPEDRVVWKVDLENEGFQNVSKRLLEIKYDKIEKLEELLRQDKFLENSWKNLIESKDSIVSIISQKLLETIKSNDRLFYIDNTELLAFTKSKIEKLYELTEKERNVNEIELSQIENKYNNIENINFKKHKKTKNREKIKVTFPDQTVYNYSTVVNTFVATLNKIGLKRIISLDMYRSGIPLVSKEKDENYNQKQIEEYWIMTGTSTEDKIEDLNEIIKRLNLQVKIETYMVSK